MPRIIRFALLAVGAWCFAAPVLADHNDVLVVSKQGYYILATDPVTGTPTLLPIQSHFKQVIVLDDPLPNPDPALTQRAIAIRDAALKATGDPARADTAVKLSLLYTEVANKIDAGQVKGFDAIAFIAKAGADAMIGANTLAWKPFRDTLNAQFTALVQEGGNDAAFSKLLREVSDGLGASIPNREYHAIDIRQMLTLIKAIIEIILQMLPPQPAPGPPAPVLAPSAPPKPPANTPPFQKGPAPRQ